MISQLIRCLLKPQDPHQTCSLHHDESAQLRAELHECYDRNRQLSNSVARLQAENGRLADQNHDLRLSQKQKIIEELAERIIERKARAEAPVVILPCPQHRRAELTFNTA